MKRSPINWLSNITLIAGGGIAAYVLIQTIRLRSTLPAGACPLTDNRALIYTAIGLLLASVVLSFFDRKKPPAGKPDTADDPDDTAPPQDDDTPPSDESK